MSLITHVRNNFYHTETTTKTLIFSRKLKISLCDHSANFPGYYILPALFHEFRSLTALLLTILPKDSMLPCVYSVSFSINLLAFYHDFYAVL